MTSEHRQDSEIEALLTAAAAPRPRRMQLKKRSAVAIVLRRTACGQDLEVLFIKRAVREDKTRNWSGHVAFPGQSSWFLHPLLPPNVFFSFQVVMRSPATTARTKPLQPVKRSRRLAWT